MGTKDKVFELSEQNRELFEHNKDLISRLNAVSTTKNHYQMIVSTLDQTPQKLSTNMMDPQNIFQRISPIQQRPAGRNTYSTTK